jgi:hypothetical protein
MYRTYILVIFASVYIGLHAVFGYLNCKENFCPGDNHNDWVYEYTDDSGKKFIVENGKTIPAEQYKETK